MVEKQNQRRKKLAGVWNKGNAHLFRKSEIIRAVIVRYECTCPSTIYHINALA